ncbi:iron ABC transporter permease [Alkalihalobacillus alcalophilus ATCC 27647 = CGMCC 1.3604]|uniref:Cobalamin/Fe3+-siderophores transporter n=1 Tax=Alkalihalobacillus alcalophilus ATCC 27647 = CGMCC 1.3604 TaxID=1218173 RepID=J8TP78_ALKAL|nr:iron ABC transporter permease [Alkalihalobacillus alcalophilus]AFV25639.1 cobalamin/Fe3+-siderophores transporter [Alkalihalobacillus alcalophilus ATCC 27647 = CGMCC 1.3604]KGA97168.1 iron ABC transporter permease [Alkalihalobacillus alcalophilus ATCC 27647 = CGMCC 1.3604]MED1560900.1 iron ABC transporter permease [Alkalihalobacillus alcalophilus]THG89593.1 iron ABC transporter permease [Alkalihalobacillus alcalophilus ATCC 27647 = CGMCC 1.3604]
MKNRSRRRKGLIIFAPLLLIIVSLFGLTYGSVSVPFTEIWRVLTGNEPSIYQTILVDLRLPRILIGLLVGACLAVAGCILQGVMRNPLADPGIIGVTAGGGLMASMTMLVFPHLSYMLPISAFLGAFVTAMIIYFLAWDKGASPLKIILAGVAINALVGAVQNGLMVIFSDRIQSVIPWLAGGLNGRSWYHLEFMAPYAIVGLLLSLLAIKPANLLLLGDDSAKLLGQKVELQRFLLITLAAFLAGAAVSVAGLIGFVGLVVPHAIRLLIGEDYRYLLPLSAVYGAILVVLADTIARSWFDPIELPVGVLLAALGAPFFLYLLKKRGLM